MRSRTQVMGHGLSRLPVTTRQCVRIGLIVPSVAPANGHGPIETPAVSLLVQFLQQLVGLRVFALRQPAGLSNSFLNRDIPSVTTVPVPRSDQHAPRTRQIVQQAVAAIVAAHRRQPFDLLHALWLHEPGSVAVIAARLLRIPVVVSIGGAEVVHLPALDYGTLRTRRGRLIVRQVLRAATVVTGGSRSVLALAEQAAGQPLRHARIPLPIEAAPFAAVRGAPFRADLVQIAALLPVKHQTLLLRAVQQVQASRPGTTLTILGEDPHERAGELLRMAEELGLGGLVTYVGRVPHAALPTAIAGHRLHVQTSLHESQGLGVLEAAAAGIPSVGTSVGVLGDLAPQAAVSIAAPDTVLLAEAIQQLLRDDGRRAQISAAAERRVAAEYDIEPVGAAWLDLYQQLARRTAGR